MFVHGKGESFRTQRTVLRGLIEDGLLLVVGDNMTDVLVTQKGLSALDHLQGYPRRRLPEALHPTIRPLALQKLAELRLVGFEDPVDALLAVAYETDEAGEFVQPVQIRIEALKAAAPFVRPKLAAVVQKNTSDGQSHAEWLKEIRDEIDGGDEEADPKVNGEA